MMGATNERGTERPGGASGWTASLRALQKGFTALFILVLPLLFYINNTAYAEAKVAFVILGLSVVLGLWIVETWFERRTHFGLPTLFWPGLALIAAGGLSLLNASSVGLGLEHLGLLVYSFLFYAFVAHSVTDKVTLRLYVGAGLLAVLLASTYGLLQYDGLLPGNPNYRLGGSTMIASFGNKNFLAEWVNGWLLAGLVLLGGLASTRLKAWALVCVGLGFAALWAVDSVGATLGLLVGGVFGLGGAALTRSFKALVASKAVLVGWAGIALLTFVLIVTPGPLRVPDCSAQAASCAVQRENVETPSTQQSVAPTPETSKPGASAPTLFERLLETGARFFRENSGSTRVWDWLIAVEMFYAHPWVGVGLGQYGVEFLNYKAAFAQTERGQQFDFHIRTSDEAHNDYVQAAAEMGLAGVAAILWLVVALVWRGVQQLRRQRDGHKRLATLALYAGVVAFATDAAVNFPVHLLASGLSAVLFLGLAHAPYLGGRPLSFRLGLPVRRLVGALALLFVLGSSVVALRAWNADLHLEAGNRLVSRGLFHEAQVEYNRSLDLDVAPREVLFRLGTVSYRLEDLDRAAYYFERSTQSYAAEDTYWNLAVVKAQQGQYAEAKRLLERLLAIKPGGELVRKANDLLQKLAERNP